MNIIIEKDGGSSLAMIEQINKVTKHLIRS